MVRNGLVDIASIDTAVERVLTLKEDLGLFENPYKDLSIDDYKHIFLCDEHRKIAKEAVIKSSVLLKNNNILPFSKDIKTLAIIGPHGDNKEIIGEWKAIGNSTDAVSLAEGIKNKFGDNIELIIEKGCDFLTCTELDIAKLQSIVKKADAVVLALGEESYMSGEGGSRSSIEIPGSQQALADAVLSGNKPTAMVLFTGRPLDLSWYHHHMDAILNVWFPGTEGGNGIADLLFGDENPSGKLTMTFPRNIGQIPIYYNHFNTGRPTPDIHYNYGKPYRTQKEYTSNYLDVPNSPLYPFGYGLSYTTFDYNNLCISDKTMAAKDTITVSVDITNNGQRNGEEIVQLYIQDVKASVARPLKELKCYEKVFISCGETSTITFEITEPMLRFYTKDMTYNSEKGDFNVYVGRNSSETLATSFKLV